MLLRRRVERRVRPSCGLPRPSWLRLLLYFVEAFG